MSTTWNGPWLWLFPATYAAHLVEETLAGEGFHRWIRRVTGKQLTTARFLALNAVYFAAMCVIVVSARRSADALLVAALGALVAANGVGHVIGTFVTRSYSPGVVTGTVLWIPLGIYAVAVVPDARGTGALVGVVALAIVGLSAVALGRRAGARPGARPGADR